jgi:hypothetical protein
MQPMATKRAQHHTKKPDRERKERLSAAARALVSFMVNDGDSRSQAAARAKISDHWAYQLLLKPSVRALRAEMLRSLRESEASRSIARAAKLANDAGSEHVRLDATKWLAEIEGIAAVARSDIRVDHVHHSPGLVIVRPYAEATARRAQMEANPQRLIDVTPHEPVTMIEEREEDVETNIAILRDRGGR